MSKNPHAISWDSEEFEKLVDLVKPHPCLYHVQDPSRKNILERETTWEKISEQLHKPVEECKKRWKALRDGYMKTQRIGEKRTPSWLFTKLDFLNDPLEEEPEMLVEKLDDDEEEPVEESEQEVVMDNQEYFKIVMMVDNPEPPKAKTPKLMVPPIAKRIQKPSGRRKKNQLPSVSLQQLQPIKILPKPMLVNPSIIQYVEEKPKIQPPPPKPQKSEVIDSLIEKVLKEHTNEIDVFFRSMAASVKKLQPNLIPKVKMEVCNVIAKYEMQSFNKNGSH